MSDEELAKAITDHLFGLVPEAPVTRIQFMAGKYPDSEKPMGGLARASFERQVLEAIQKARGAGHE